MGPWIVPADEINDLQNVPLKLWVNDSLMQNATTANMVFSIAEQIDICRDDLRCDLVT